MYTPEHVERWKEQINYEGDNFDDFYVIMFRFFRCTPLERANFKYISDHLKDSGADDGHVIFPSFTDEVMMCRYYIMVHKDADRALRMADMFAGRIKRKGSLDPDLESAMNWKGVRKSWHMKSLRAKISLCSEAGISIFAAREVDPKHDDLLALLSEAA